MERYGDRGPEGPLAVLEPRLALPKGYQERFDALGQDALATGRELLEHHLVRFAADAAGAYGGRRRMPGLGVVVADERFVQEYTFAANGGDEVLARYLGEFERRHGTPGPLLSDAELTWRFFHEEGGDINCSPPKQGKDGVQVFDRMGNLVGVGRYIDGARVGHPLVRPVYDRVHAEEGNFGGRHTSAAFAATLPGVEAAYIVSQEQGNVKRLQKEHVPLIRGVPLLSRSRLRYDVLWGPEQPAPRLAPVEAAA